MENDKKDLITVYTGKYVGYEESEIRRSIIILKHYMNILHSEKKLNSNNYFQISKILSDLCDFLILNIGKETETDGK